MYCRKSGSPTHQQSTKPSSAVATAMPSNPIAYHCVDATHQYHLHTISTDDFKTWQKLLLTVLEEDRSLQVLQYSIPSFDILICIFDARRQSL